MSFHRINLDQTLLKMPLKRKRSRSGFQNYCKKIDKTHLKDENNNDDQEDFLNLVDLDNSLKEIESSLIQENVKNDQSF